MEIEGEILASLSIAPYSMSHSVLILSLLFFLVSFSLFLLFLIFFQCLFYFLSLDICHNYGYLFLEKFLFSSKRPPHPRAPPRRTPPTLPTKIFLFSFLSLSLLVLVICVLFLLVLLQLLLFNNCTNHFFVNFCKSVCFSFFLSFL